jgi:hypothetical protein
MAFNVWYWPIKAHREMHYGVGQAVSMYFGEMKHRLVKNR